MKARINDPRVSIELVSTPKDPGVSNSRTPLFAAIRKAILKTIRMPWLPRCWCRTVPIR